MAFPNIFRRSCPNLTITTALRGDTRAASQLLRTAISPHHWEVKFAKAPSAHRLSSVPSSFAADRAHYAPP